MASTTTTHQLQQTLDRALDSVHHHSDRLQQTVVGPSLAKGRDLGSRFPVGSVRRRAPPPWPFPSRPAVRAASLKSWCPPAALGQTFIAVFAVLSVVPLLSFLCVPPFAPGQRLSAAAITCLPRPSLHSG